MIYPWSSIVDRTVHRSEGYSLNRSSSQSFLSYNALSWFICFVFWGRRKEVILKVTYSRCGRSVMFTWDFEWIHHLRVVFQLIIIIFRLSNLLLKDNLSILQILMLHHHLLPTTICRNHRWTCSTVKLYLLALLRWVYCFTVSITIFEFFLLIFWSCWDYRFLLLHHQSLVNLKVFNIVIHNATDRVQFVYYISRCLSST